MAGYLDHYGEGDEKREKLIKRVVVILLAVVVAGASLYFGFRNYRQKARINEFVKLLRKQDYKSAYQFWGCTDAKPCPEYTFDKFMEDWGPKSQYAQIADFSITKSRACGTGVIVTARFSGDREEKFWVENKDLTIGYSPWPVCPSR